MDFFPTVVQAIAGPKRTIYIYFLDGHIKQFDMAPLIEKGGIYSCLADDVFFREQLTVMNDTAAWDLSGRHDPDNCIDIDPETLYQAPEVEDPLKKPA